MSLIGLIPASVDRQALVDEVEALAGDLPVTDLLETADYPEPALWDAAQRYGLRALDRLPRSKISVSPGRVAVTAISDNAEQKALIEGELRRGVPRDVRVDLSISAPRPMIAPYTTRFVLDGDTAGFDACVADSPEAIERIVAAAARAGTENGDSAEPSCIEGLGAPSRRWGEAVEMGIDAVAELGGGTITFSDTDVTLAAAQGTSQDLFDRVVGRLSNALPEVFALDATLPDPPSDGDEDPVSFTATLSPEGDVQIRGRVSDTLMNETLANFAHAQFGPGVVTMGTREADDLPPGWRVRTLAAVAALAELSNGAVIVTPGQVSVRGNTGNTEARSRISRLLIDRLGEQADFTVDVTYVESLDPIAGLPTAEECVDNILRLTEERRIIFDPGSATLTAESEALVDDIAEVLRRCADLRLEVAGYTDSQGRDSMNLALSQDRANSVLAALRQRRVPVGSFDAVGYGEADPIADNATEEGREANRRIEFRLITPDPVASEEAGRQASEADPAAAATGPGDTGGEDPPADTDEARDADEAAARTRPTTPATRTPATGKNDMRLGDST